MAKRWQDLRAKAFTPEQLKKIDEGVAEELRSMRELRELLGLTQADVARLANMTQSEVSRFERRDDHKLSSVREVVEALGGELEVFAVFDGKRVRVA